VTLTFLTSRPASPDCGGARETLGSKVALSYNT